MILEMCFILIGCSMDINFFIFYFEEDGISIFVFCKKCSVWVYVSCYGVFFVKVFEDWMCFWCLVNVLEEDCCLCLL